MSRQAFEYCPMCATPMTEQYLFQRMRRVCPACRFIQFHDPKVAVIALVTCAERILLIQRGVDPEKGKWALPGGYMDAGELPEHAMQRELQEEVGLSVSVKRLIDIYPMLSPDMHNRSEKSNVNNGIVLAYHAVPCDERCITLTPDDDASDARWFSAHALPSSLAFESTRQLLARWQNNMI